MAYQRTKSLVPLSPLSDSLSDAVCGNQMRWKKHCEQKEAKIQIFNDLLSADQHILLQIQT